MGVMKTKDDADKGVAKGVMGVEEQPKRRSDRNQGRKKPREEKGARTGKGKRKREGQGKERNDRRKEARGESGRGHEGGTKGANEAGTKREKAGRGIKMEEDSMTEGEKSEKNREG